VKILIEEEETPRVRPRNLTSLQKSLLSRPGELPDETASFQTRPQRHERENRKTARSRTRACNPSLRHSLRGEEGYNLSKEGKRRTFSGANTKKERDWRIRGDLISTRFLTRIPDADGQQKLQK